MCHPFCSVFFGYPHAGFIAISMVVECSGCGLRPPEFQLCDLGPVPQPELVLLLSKMGSATIAWGRRKQTADGQNRVSATQA